MRQFLARFCGYAAAITAAVYIVDLHRGVTSRFGAGWFGLGVVLSVVGLWLVLALALSADRLARRFSLRRFLVAANVALMCVLAGGVVVFANVISARHYKVIDRTFKGSYTITERTKRVIETLPRKVVVHVLVSSGNAYMINIRGLLDAYRATAPERLEVEYWNPGQNREAVEKKLFALGIDPQTFKDPQGRVVIFEGLDPDARVPHTKVVELEDMVEVDYSMGPENARLKGFRGEELFTRALLDVTREKPTTVYFLSGHREVDALESNARERVKSLDTALRNLNFDVRPLDWATGSAEKDVPADCDVLAILGPKSRFDDKEIAALKAYLERGGRLLLMAEPVVRPRPGTTSVFFLDTQLDLLLKDYGISLGQAMVHDPATAHADFKFETKFEGSAHPIVRPLAGLGMVWETALPLEILPPQPALRVRVEKLVETLPSAVSVSNLDAVAHGRDPESVAEKKGPFVLAAAVVKELAPPTATAEVGSKEKREARLVVTGDASIASDKLVTAVLGQLNFVLNAIAWLGEREDSISIESKPPEILHLQLGPRDSWLLQLLGLVEVPLACAAIAFFVWDARRS